MKFKCPLCLSEHEIDSTGWIQSCEGYLELGEFIKLLEIDVDKMVENL